jgi:NAD(P)-dependent dehydrogenase (short-subunit alcohol dehydrogenase family)
VAGTRLDGQVAIITGATGNIGRAIAAMFAREGAQLVLSGTRPDAVDLPQHAAYHAGDITSDRVAAELVALALDRYGRLDTLVNAHGLDFHSELPATSLDEARRLLDVNVVAVLATMKHALPELERSGNGAIVNIASRLGLIAIPGQAVYSASKGALIMLSKGAAIDYARRGVRVNVVAPGVTSTEMIDLWVSAQTDPVAFRNRLEDSIPMGRLAERDEVASAALFLASSDSQGITGAVLSVDGGYTAA